jgi:hypothetical protein
MHHSLGTIHPDLSLLEELILQELLLEEFVVARFQDHGTRPAQKHKMAPAPVVVLLPALAVLSPVVPGLVQRLAALQPRC